MRKSLALIATLSLMGCSVVSAPVVAEESSTNHKRMLPVDTEVVTDSVEINGETVDYTATAGTQPVWDRKGNGFVLCV